MSSTRGFSFLPPQGDDWTKQVERENVTYLKRTDPTKVSFYVGALDGKLRAELRTKEDLVSFARAKKDQWGDDKARYSNISTSFAIESINEFCVLYRLTAHDRKAKNKGRHDFLMLDTAGRFCLHPRDRTTAADIYYSVRYIPTFDPKDLVAEGEAFIGSLQFQQGNEQGSN